MAPGDWVENILLALCADQCQAGGSYPCPCLKGLWIQSYSFTEDALDTFSTSSEGDALGALASNLLERRQHTVAVPLSYLGVNFGDSATLQKLGSFIKGVEILVRSPIFITRLSPVDLLILYPHSSLYTA